MCGTISPPILREAAFAARDVDEAFLVDERDVARFDTSRP